MATENKTTSKINPFAKAQGKTAAAPKAKSKKETIWAISPSVSDQPTVDQLNKAVAEMQRLKAERSQIETEEEIHKSILKEFASGRYIDALVSNGVEPESPLKIVNDKHQSVTYVVQDRGTQTKVTDKQVEDLVELLGEDATKEVVFEKGTFSFDDEVMAQIASPDENGDPRTVQDVVAAAMAEMLSKLVEDNQITADQVDGLLTFKTERCFVPKVVSKATIFCGRKRSTLERFFDILGSAMVRYCRV